jgi:hypothetical protein
LYQKANFIPNSDILADEAAAVNTFSSVTIPWISRDASFEMQSMDIRPCRADKPDIHWTKRTSAGQNG